MSTIFRTAPALAVFALAAAAPAQAQVQTQSQSQSQDHPETDINGDTITIGGGGVYVPDYEGSKHYRFTAAPGAIGQYKGFNFVVAGNRASLDLIPNEPGQRWDLQAGPVVMIDFNRSTKSQIEDPQIKALGERKSSLAVGGYVGLGRKGVFTSRYDKLSLSVSYRKGISGANRGTVIQPTVNYFTPLSRKIAVGLIGSAEHANRTYGEAYFDVDTAGSLASGLPVYRTGSGWKNWTVGALGTYALTGNLLHGFKFVGGVTYKRMLGDYADSPIVSVVGSKSQWLGVAGIAYTF